MSEFLPKATRDLYRRLRPRHRYAGLLGGLVALLLPPSLARLAWPGAEAVIGVLVFGTLVARSSFGQLYLALIVARLVGMYSGAKRSAQ